MWNPKTELEKLLFPQHSIRHGEKLSATNTFKSDQVLLNLLIPIHHQVNTGLSV